ncbi:transcriptional regulator, AraC family [Pseudovibrio denitrificans]|uniref:Transcriptional regulator, AraC family n=1 Tax=Pseudovibrio denitrificans TaxID=258256 RepID=A0A1I7C4I2_9HYPH|nr:AraC family transcriptional regulator [Pseudovibrio denitrificans]SFT94316.1 transcriptional regulator, AraC family [Pseudovibrio denitrificans]
MSFQAVIREYNRLELGHRHAFAQAVIPLQGEMDIEIGGQFKELKVGSVGLIAPETLHDSETTSGSRFLIIDVSDKAAITQFFRNANDSHLELSPLALKYLNFVASLTDTFATDATGASTILNTALELATGQGTDLANQSMTSTRLMSVKDQLPAPVKISELAKEEGFSVSSLQKNFKASFGKSPKQVQLEMRLNKALGLLRSSNQTMASIAYEVGYENASSFTNIFKKHFGLTPSQYRAQYRASLTRHN